MNRKKLLVPVKWMALLFLLCGSCQKSTVENQDGIALKPHLSLIDEIILESPEAGPALRMANAIAVMEGYIIILDHPRRSVEVFDIEGNYKWPIGSRGDGEGQYKLPRKPAVIPNTNQILICDQGGKRQTLRFSIKGEFLGELKRRRSMYQMLVSEDHNLIHTYVDRDRNGMLGVTSLDTGEDIAKFKVSEAQYGRLLSTLRRLQGLAYDEERKIIYVALPWEDKVMRIDLATQEFLTPITINHPKFINLKLDEIKTENESSKPPNFGKFSKLYGMSLLSSGDILLRYMFMDSSNSTALILLSDLDAQPSIQELKNELGYNVFTCHEQSVYMYSPPIGGEDTNGRIRVYRLIAPPESPTG